MRFGQDSHLSRVYTVKCSSIDIQVKTMFTRGLLQCEWRLDCYRGFGGNLEGIDCLNIHSCRWQFVQVLDGPWKERHLIHCDIGIPDEKPL